MVEHSVAGANYCPGAYLIMAAALANNSLRTHNYFKSKHEFIMASSL